MDNNKLTVEEFGQSVKLKYPQYQGMSDREIGEATLSKYPEYQDRIKPETGVGADLKGIVTGIKDSAIKRADATGEIKKAQDSGEQGMVRSLLQRFGQGAGFASDIVGETFMGVAKALTPQKAQEAIGDTVATVAQGIAESQPAQEMVEWYGSLDDVQKRDVDATLGTLGLALDVAGGALIKNPVKKAVTETIDTVSDTVKAGANVVNDVAKPVTDTVKAGADTVTDFVTDIPRRAKTNIDTAQATRQAIQNLPSDTAKTAVRDGIDLNDVRKLYTVTDPNTQSSFKKLHETVKAFEKGETTTNPIELVGKPIVTRLKTLDTEAQKVGKQLSEVADDLGSVTQAELEPVILNKLQSVRGLEGIKLADQTVDAVDTAGDIARVEKGQLLDFSDTALASTLSKTDQKAIDDIFKEAVADGSGKSKHLLRQELFEILDGKKKSLENITGTQERAFQAVRQALSDVLDTKNADYKRLNQEYATIITPVNEMRKLMKLLDPDIDEDLLDMSAGLIARRLTSNSMSNPKIRLILRQLDQASSVKGQTTLSVEELQDFYNILERYYDIAGKTGFQGQITSALEKGGIVSQGVDMLKQFAGRSDSVRQKALEDLISEIYGQ